MRLSINVTSRAELGEPLAEMRADEADAAGDQGFIAFEMAFHLSWHIERIHLDHSFDAMSCRMFDSRAWPDSAEEVRAHLR